MIIKNNTNGKEIVIEKNKFDTLNHRQKMNFTVISETDSSTIPDQIVENIHVVKNAVIQKQEDKKIIFKKKTPPASGEKAKDKEKL